MTASNEALASYQNDDSSDAWIITTGDNTGDASDLTHSIFNPYIFTPYTGTVGTAIESDDYNELNQHHARKLLIALVFGKSENPLEDIMTIANGASPEERKILEEFVKTSINKTQDDLRKIIKKAMDLSP